MSEMSEVIVNLLNMASLETVVLVIVIVLPRRQSAGWSSVVFALAAPIYMLLGLPWVARFCLAWLVFTLWAWWRSGGGDGTKRRLRNLARRFRGVRRTAPALGSA